MSSRRGCRVITFLRFSDSVRNDEASPCLLYHNLRSGLRHRVRDSPTHDDFEEKAYYLPSYEIEVRQLGISVYHHDPGSIFKFSGIKSGAYPCTASYLWVPTWISYVPDLRTGADIWTMTFGCHYPQRVIEARAVRYPDHNKCHCQLRVKNRERRRDLSYRRASLLPHALVRNSGHAITVAALAIPNLGLVSRQRTTTIFSRTVVNGQTLRL